MNKKYFTTMVGSVFGLILLFTPGLSLGQEATSPENNTNQNPKNSNPSFNNPKPQFCPKGNANTLMIKVSEDESNFTFAIEEFKKAIEINPKNKN